MDRHPVHQRARAIRYTDDPVHGSFPIGHPWRPRGFVESRGTVRSVACGVGAVKKRKLARTLERHGGLVRSLALSPDGTWLVTAGRDGKLFDWEFAAGKVRAAMDGALSVPFEPSEAIAACLNEPCLMSMGRKWQERLVNDVVAGSTERPIEHRENVLLHQDDRCARWGKHSDLK